MYDLEELFPPLRTPVFDFLDGYVNKAADQLQIDLDQARILCILLCNYPFSIIYFYIVRALPSPLIKHLFTIFISLFCLAYCYGWNFLHSFIVAIVSYYLSRFFRAKKLSLFPIFVFVMGYLSISHITTTLNHYMEYRHNYTTPQMVVTIKVTQWAFEYADGIKSAEELAPHENGKKIVKTPSIFTYLGYVYFYPGVLVGPACDYDHYVEFTSGKKHVPSPWLPASKRFGFALSNMIGLVFITKPYFHYSFISNPEFSFWPFWKRAGFIVLASHLIKFQYYSVWLLAEVSYVLTGFSYQSKDGNSKGDWDRVKSNRIRKQTKASSMNELVQTWNVPTQNWLYHSVYIRFSRWEYRTAIRKQQKKAGLYDPKTPVQYPPRVNASWRATVLTNVISAFWHGFYPGYYLAFVSLAVMGILSKKMSAVLGPIFTERVTSADGKSSVVVSRFPGGKLMFLIGGWILTQLCVAYIMMPFLLMGFWETVNYFSDVYFAGHVVTIVLLVVVQVVQMITRKHKNEKKKKEN